MKIFALYIMKNGFTESVEIYLKQNQLKLVLCQTFPQVYFIGFHHKRKSDTF